MYDLFYEKLENARNCKNYDKSTNKGILSNLRHVRFLETTNIIILLEAEHESYYPTFLYMDMH